MSGYSEILSTEYGQMIVNKHDINQTNALRSTRKSLNHGDIMEIRNMMVALARPIVFVDAGANFGTFSLAMAQAVPPDSIIMAFEPQRILANMIAGSIALNSLNNVWCYNAALGAQNGKIEIPQFDYSLPLNFGSVEFSSKQTEPLQQIHGDDDDKREYVDVYALDSFELDKLDLLKIDVEGMEVDVIQGAAQTILRCKPVMFIEWIKSDSAAIERTVRSYGYTVEPFGSDLLCRPAKWIS